MSKCESCNCDIYIKEKIEDFSPGVQYKDKLYCSKCIEGIYFLEDIEHECEDEPIKKDESVKTKTTSVQILVCPTCKLTIETIDKKCSKCNKIHPLFIRKPKKKRNRKKK
jgi:hypothetical protein